MTFRIGRRRVGEGASTLVVAELSANHRQEFDEAVKLVKAAKEAGADAVKLQTYTAETLTLRCDSEHFRIQGGTLWDGRSLFDLYEEAYTPWEWQPKLKAIAEELELVFFSTAFDPSAVDFLEEMDVPAHKVASPEIVDLPLIEKMARTGKPVIISTGMATFEEIEEALQAARGEGATQIALLKCTSAYPAPFEEMNLRTVPHLMDTFRVPVGVSDHTLGAVVPLGAVALGASIVEKHLTLSRDKPGPDSAFSLETHEFKAMVDALRDLEKALGEAHYGASHQEAKIRRYRRSLFAVRNIKAGEIFTEENVRSIRPANGLSPKFLRDVLGRRAAYDIVRGTPLSRSHLGDR
jgi:N-acetylneuraminate synthase